MTEAGWLTCSDPTPMLVFLRDKVSDRKFRLLALACCERIADLITDPRSRAAIAFAERLAEVGVAKRRGRPGAVRAADLVSRELGHACWRTADAEERSRFFIAWNAALLFWLRQWFLPALADAFGKAGEDLDAAREQLRAELGREPTRDEVGDRLAKLHGWESSPLMPDRRPP